MKVRDLMQQNVITIEADAPIVEAVGRLADAHVLALPVVDRHGKLIGVLSTTDILTAEAERTDAASRDQLFQETSVRDLMTARPLTVSPETDVREAAQQMLYAEVHRLFVEEDGALVGVLSQTDIVTAVATRRV
jgi:CBS-domain-containing membrane protein